MKTTLPLLLTAIALAACSPHSKETIAAVRSAGVASTTVAKLERSRVLLPEDFVELRRRNVQDSVPIRHLDKVGVDYIAQRNDILRMRRGGVRPPVVDALIQASDAFARDHAERPYRAWSWGVVAPIDPWYYPYYDPFWPYY
jgi:hypothetical protein